MALSTFLRPLDWEKLDLSLLDSSPRTSPGTVLDRIVENRRTEVAHRKKTVPETVLRIAAQKAEPVRDFAGALTGSQINVIAELKKASPSAGLLRAEFHPGILAQGYEAGGAAAISIVTEESNFHGALAHLRDARKATSLPVLRKDFIVEAWQVWESRAANADSFLLIVAALSRGMLKELLTLGRDLGIEPLVEVHTREELDTALNAGARIVGVNNRNLHTLEVRVDTSFELIEAIPDECIAVSESGLRSADDLVRLRAAGFDAFLIGEHFMRNADPGAALKNLLTARS